MQKWEYLFVTADYALGAWRSRFENDLEVVNWKQAATLRCEEVELCRIQLLTIQKRVLSK